MFCDYSKSYQTFQKIMLILMTCLLFVSVFAVSAAETGTNSVTPPVLDTKIRLNNLAHTDKVLNIYSSTPSNGCSVSISSWSDNNTQWWRNIYLGKKDSNNPETKYYRLEVYTNSSLVLAFNSGTSPAYIKSVSSIYASDYELKWLAGNYNSSAYRVKLFSYYRLLGVTVSNNNFCYWYTFANNDLDNATSEENWLFYTVT